MMRANFIAALVLLIPAWLTLPLERRIHAERARLKYGGARVSLEFRDRIGQGMAIGLLAGFRGVVADFLWIQSHSYWERKEWLRQYRNIELVTLLQPQAILFWDLGQWHMAWNIAYAVRTDPRNRTQAEGIKREREWHERARQFLQRGIENVPHRHELYFMMGWLYQEKFKEPCNAAKYYGIAMQFEDAPGYIARLYPRALERCGDAEAAYQHWKWLWSQDHTKVRQLWHIVEREIRRLEDQLSIPEAERVFPKQPEP
jgi:hypothetical protein